ncbi:MAG TPA: PD-(D/E)XK motif protein [Terriglobia bacterium]|nr:PD-(D/E)XK motif protein [Terriglobia bacterium]
MSAEEIWNDLRAERERPIFRRVSEDHPYDIYVGIDLHEAPVLMLLSAHPVEQLPRLKALDLSQTVRHDGKFAIVIALSVSELLHPFSHVCEDLIASLRQFHPAGREAAFLLTRLEKWRRLLEATRKGLSHEELLGLIGELLFLERLIARVGEAPAINAWLGPTGAPQDFQSGEHIYEIKVCAIAAHKIAISSLDQLHTPGTHTTLIVFSIGSAGAEQGGAFSTNSLVSRIRRLISDPIASSAFDVKLAEVGFDETQEESDALFVVDKERAFDVRRGFPCLTPLSVPSAVVSAQYCIDLDGCAQFEIPFSSVTGK